MPEAYRDVPRLTFRSIAIAAMWMIASVTVLSAIRLCARAEAHFAPLVKSSPFHSLCEVEGCGRPATQKADSMPDREAHLFCDAHFPKAGPNSLVFGDMGAPITKRNDPCNFLITWMIICIAFGGLLFVPCTCRIIVYLVSGRRVPLSIGQVIGRMTPEPPRTIFPAPSEPPGRLPAFDRPPSQSGSEPLLSHGNHPFLWAILGLALAWLLYDCVVLRIPSFT